ncbi:MAG: RsmE family RNA methyltransferase [Rikenellaceae bacterium]
MQLFYYTNLECGLEVGQRYTLCDELSHHCIVVLRRSKGDVVMVCNGKGWLYSSRIEVASKKAAELVIEEVNPNFGCEQKREIIVGLAPTKNMDRVEWAVEKMVEIGATKIVPIISMHSERRTIKIDRLRRIALSAAQQSLKGFLPTIEEAQSFKTFVENNHGGYIAHCNEGQKTRIEAGADKYTVLIGPEGDFSLQEVDLALKCGYKEITLGSARLRTETAAVCAAYMCTL